MRTVNGAAQARSGDYSTLASHQCSLAAIHPLHWLAHAAFALARRQRNTRQRGAGQREQKHQRCELRPHNHIHFMAQLQSLSRHRTAGAFARTGGRGRPRSQSPAGPAASFVPCVIVNVHEYAG